MSKKKQFKIKNFFDRSFLQNLVVLMLGLLIGIPFALWTNRIIEEKSKQGDKIALAQALLITLNRNLEIIDNISPKIGSVEMVDEKLDLTVLENVSEYKYRILSLKSCTAIDEATYHLRWYHQKIDTLLRWVLESQSNPIPFMLPNGLEFIRGSLAGHRGVVEGHAKLAIKLLREERKNLGKTEKLPNKSEKQDEN